MADMSNKMTKERWQELMKPFEEGDGVMLTSEEIDAGWHWCEEWDGLLIHVDDDEFDCCSCSWMQKFKTPERMKIIKERMDSKCKSQEALNKLSDLDEELGLH